MSAFSGKSIANNLTTSSAGYVLDARQGKALNDKIGALIVRETSAPPFTNGVATVSAKSGYKLLNVITSRNDTDYSISTVTETSSGSYLLYTASGVSANISIISYWIKV